MTHEEICKALKYVGLGVILGLVEVWIAELAQGKQTKARPVEGKRARARLVKDKKG
jgi:hypothetical protein